jgi:hypothetical protein
MENIDRNSESQYAHSVTSVLARMHVQRMLKSMLLGATDINYHLCGKLTRSKRGMNPLHRKPSPRNSPKSMI